jgi:hypothetical protein
MSDMRHNYPVWDRLFQLLYPCDEQLSDAEIDADLKRAGIDMEAAYRRLNTIVELHRARAKLAGAKQIRASLCEQIHNVVAPRLDDLRSGVKNLINKALSGPEQLAYFHKLESAATDQDLQSLMDDLEKLAAIRELRDDAQSK